MNKPRPTVCLALTLALGAGVGWLAHGLFTPRLEPVAVVVPAAPPPAASAPVLTLATYNLHNLFDPFDNPYTQDEGTTPKTKRELDLLAEALRTLDADVVILQEVEAGGALKRFVQERLAGARYEYVVDETTEDPRGIGVAALSRVPVRRIVSHRLLRWGAGEERQHLTRDLLRLDLDTGRGLLAVYGVHRKSKRDTPGDPTSARWRLEEARQISRIVQDETQREKLAWYAVLGDCNDTPDSPPVRALLEGGLKDALAGRKGAERVSFISPAYQDAIDQVLLSPDLAPGLAEPATVLRGGVFEQASDHRPVRATLRLP